MSTCLACNDCGEVIYEDFWPEVERGPCPHIERDTLRAENERQRAACRAALLGLDAAGACDPDVACGYNTSLGGETTQEHDIIHADEHMAYRLLRAVLQQEQPATKGE